MARASNILPRDEGPSAKRQRSRLRTSTFAIAENRQPLRVHDHEPREPRARCPSPSLQVTTRVP
jgi:hypothetical protein